jgi:phosphate-selective porin OprO/OprP
VHLLLVERTFVGNQDSGVPDRALGAHVRGEFLAGKLAYWGTVGALGHEPNVDRLRLNSLVGAESATNEGVIVAARLDLHPRGSMTFFDSDPHTPEIKYTWSLAGYAWENDGTNNSLTEGGISLDPERADLDFARGLEISGGLRGRGVMLDWQYNLIRGETLIPDFTGGLYVDGATELNSMAVEGGYWIPGRLIEVGGSLSRIDADGYIEPWDTAGLALNIHWLEKYNAKLQITHTWIFSRNGVPDLDFQQTRIQAQYAW